MSEHRPSPSTAHGAETDAPGGRAEARARGPEGAATDGDVLFDAVITPHRSLSPRGFTMLMATIGTLSFISGMIFVSIGAWPVFGFLGLTWR